MSSRAAADVDIRTFDFELLPLGIGNIGIGNNSTLATLRQNSALVSSAYIVYTTAILRGACAAREHSPENGKPAGRLINVASTLHVVRPKYFHIFE